MNSKVKTAAGVLFWLIVWQAAAMLLDKSIILPSPTETLAKLFELMGTDDFLKILSNSFVRITAGLLTGTVTGVILAVLSKKHVWAAAITLPLIRVIKSVPVASFIVLVLFWTDSRYLSMLIALLMVLPIIYDGVYEGAQAADEKLIEMAMLHGFSSWNRIRFIYIPAVMPSFSGALSSCVGLAFKSGTAAEVIARTDNTLGEMIYSSKIYLETAELFSWTIVIIILGKLTEILVKLLINAVYRRLQSLY